MRDLSTISFSLLIYVSANQVNYSREDVNQSDLGIISTDYNTVRLYVKDPILTACHCKIHKSF
jgi:hypothetical protein